MDFRGKTRRFEAVARFFFLFFKEKLIIDGTSKHLIL